MVLSKRPNPPRATNARREAVQEIHQQRCEARVSGMFVSVCVVSCRSMLMLRRRLSRFAAGWLVCQLCVLSVTPAILCARMPSTAGGVECTCSHGDGQVCPMHHTTSTSKSKTKPCSCRSTTDSAAVAIASLFGQTGVLAAPIGAADPLRSSEHVVRSESDPLDSFRVPDAPPPRA